MLREKFPIFLRRRHMISPMTGSDSNSRADRATLLKPAIDKRLAAILAASVSIFAFSSHSHSAYAESVQGAVVTRTEGDAKLMMKKLAGASAPTGATAILFENETYFVRAAKNGDRPGNGDVVTTGKDGKVRLIYRNGDQVTVTPGTAFKFSWDPKTDKGALAEIVYGDIRAVIQPEGPRSGMKVKTKSAVMGVRGTDFYVSAWSKDAGSKVAVMRGKVAVAAKAPEPMVVPEPLEKKAIPSGTKAKATIASKPVPPKAVVPPVPEIEPVMVEVTAGATGVIKPLKSPSPTTPGSKVEAPPPAIVVASTSKQELVVIQQDSKVAKAVIDPKAKKPDPEAAKAAAELEKLEAVSVETTLQDVKKYDPQLYAKLKEEQKTGKAFDSDQIQAETVKKIFIEAPSEKAEPRKPTIEDLDSGGDIYDKYKWERK
jgi:FecR protein